MRYNKLWPRFLGYIKVYLLEGIAFHEGTQSHTNRTINVSHKPWRLYHSLGVYSVIFISSWIHSDYRRLVNYLVLGIVILINQNNEWVIIYFNMTKLTVTRHQTHTSFMIWWNIYHPVAMPLYDLYKKNNVHFSNNSELRWRIEFLDVTV